MIIAAFLILCLCVYFILKIIQIDPVPKCYLEYDRKHHNWEKVTDEYICDLNECGDNKGRLTRRINKCKDCKRFEDDEVFYMDHYQMEYYLRKHGTLKNYPNDNL